jgi:Rieske Fe-S protein
MQRRHFIGACALGCVASGLPAAAQESVPSRTAESARPRTTETVGPRSYARARLVDAEGKPILAKTLPADRNFIFHYPYTATPCFLLRLGTPARPAQPLRTKDATVYDWPGGVGPEGTIVAFSAICSHLLTYPTRDISFISYRAEATPTSKYAKVIHCCSEHSQYDPAQGARVLAGPAPQPLAAILLDHDAASDQLFATGTLGGEMFEAFFARFDFRLATEHGGRQRTPVTGQAVVRELEAFCRQQVKC